MIIFLSHSSHFSLCTAGKRGNKVQGLHRTAAFTNANNIYKDDIRRRLRATFDRGRIINNCGVDTSPKESVGGVGAPDQMTVSQYSNALLQSVL